MFINRKAFDNWFELYVARLNSETATSESRSKQMKLANPKFILRNHIAESIIRKATDDKEYETLDDLMTILHSPYEEHTDFEHYAEPPLDWAKYIEVSCSS